MSGASAHRDPDFWEFVNCCSCHLEFIDGLNGSNSVPFWVTECGHVACENHINAENICPQCGLQDIRFAPLSIEMEPPMSRWFESAPSALDTFGYALRLQFDAMSKLIRFYKKKYVQYRPAYDRLKQEHAENKQLRSLVKGLRQENEQLRRELLNGNPEVLNQNSKRRRLDENGHYNSLRTSSPHSVASGTPIAPDRLTLPPSHHQPHFNSRQSLRSYDSLNPQRTLAQYAYAPPNSAQPLKIAAQPLSHSQAGPARRAQAREGSSILSTGDRMPPPPLPTHRVAAPEMQTHTSSPHLEGRAGHMPRPQPQFATPSHNANASSQRFIPQTPTRTSVASLSVPMRPFSTSSEQHHRARQIPQRVIPSPNQQSSRLASAGINSRSLDPRSTLATPISSGGQRIPFTPVKQFS